MTRDHWLSAPLLALAALTLGCGGPSSTTPAAPVPSLDVPPLDASAPTASEEKPKAPKLDATCSANEDCVAVFIADDCCHQCKPRIANHGWQREIEAFCAKPDNRGKCEPSGCSWGYSKPRCEKGLCK